MVERPKPVVESVPYTLLERLEAIARFLPVFESPNFSFGEWSPIKQSDGAFQLPYFSMSKDARDFEQTAYQYGWVIRLEWVAWKETQEAVRLRDDPTFLSSATTDQIENLLTVCIRQERFCEGALAGAYDSGLLTRVLRRASVLRDELSARE